MYRVDKRDFKIGQIICPNQNSYQNSFDNDKIRIEDILEAGAHNDLKGVRKNGLFVFQDFSDALKFSLNMQNSKIYAVERLTDTQCFHRGDMSFIDLMYEFCKQNDVAVAQKLAKMYWNGTKTGKPCWEMIVNKMRVSKILLADENVRSCLSAEYVNPSSIYHLKIEKLSFEYLQRYYSSNSY